MASRLRLISMADAGGAQGFSGSAASSVPAQERGRPQFTGFILNMKANGQAAGLFGEPSRGALGAPAGGVGPESQAFADDPPRAVLMDHAIVNVRHGDLPWLARKKTSGGVAAL
jgi:hypothetical protein